MEFSTILGQMLMLLLMMVLGYLARRYKFLDEHVNASLSKVVLNVTLPAQIITSFTMGDVGLTNDQVGAALGLSCLVYLFYIVLASLFVRLMRMPRVDWGTYEYMIIFGNIGFMGFPVITAIFGSKGLVYAVIMNIVFNLLVFSYGIKLITDGNEGAGKFSLRKLLNMPLASSVLALLLFFLHIKLPEVVNNGLYTMGDATTPMAMLVLGCWLCRCWFSACCTYYPASTQIPCWVKYLWYSPPCQWPPTPLCFPLNMAATKSWWPRASSSAPLSQC